MPLIKSMLDLKIEKDYVKTKLRRYPMLENWACMTSIFFDNGYTEELHLFI